MEQWLKIHAEKKKKLIIIWGKNKMDITRNDLTEEEQKLWDVVTKHREKFAEVQLQLEMLIDRKRSEKIKDYLGKTYQDTGENYIMVVGYQEMSIQVIELLSDFVIHITDIHSLSLYTEIPKKQFLTRYRKILQLFRDKIGE